MFQKGNLNTMLVGMKIGTATREIMIEVPQNLKENHLMTQQPHSWLYIQRK